ncbi:hypothetical protein GGC65_000365 [Sphingopyxis sp. OAS728]|nr:hypothetical protein [Sphingopyxis sp. OAS728]
MTKNPLPIWFVSLLCLPPAFFFGGLANYVHAERQEASAVSWLLGFEILLWVLALALALFWTRTVTRRHRLFAEDRRPKETKG